MKVFDRNLYCAGLSQLRLTGIIIGIITLALNSLPSIITGFSSLSLGNQTSAQAMVTIISASPLCIPAFYIAPVVFCIVLFYFLNNRSGSDFYHSIPHRRPTLFFSFAAAVLTWLYAILIASVLLSWVLYNAFGAYLNPAYIPYLLLSYCAAGTLVTAAMLLAMSITGTIVTNFIVCALILFLPRFIIFMFINVLTGPLRLLTSQSFGIFGDTAYNIPIAFILQVFGNRLGGGVVSDADSLLTSNGAIVYTFVLSLIYIVAACLLFSLRRSETARKSAPNRILQHIFRIAITVPFMIIIPAVVFSQIDYVTSFKNNLSAIIVMLILSIIVYFLFEIITTKKPSNLLKAAPLFLVAIAVDIVFGAAGIMVRNHAMNYKPAASSISSVTFETGVMRNVTSTSGEYNAILTQSISFTDPSIIRQVTSDLNFTISNIHSNVSYDSNGTLPHYTVALHMKNGATVIRKLDAMGGDQSRIENLKQENDTYLRDCVALPTKNETKFVQTDLNNLPKSDEKNLFDTFRREFNRLTFAEKNTLIINNNFVAPTEDEDPQIGYFGLEGTIGLQNFNSGYKITRELPDTLTLYMQLTNELNGSKVRTMLSKMKNGSLKSMNFQIIGYGYKLKNNSDNNTAILATGSQQTLSSADEEVISTVLQNGLSEELSESQPVVRMQMYNQQGDYAVCFIALTQDEAEKIASLNLTR